MSALPHGPTAGLDDADDDGSHDLRHWERSLGLSVRGLRARRWIGWRLRALVLLALLGCLALFFLMRTLAAQPALDAKLAVDAQGRVQLVGLARDRFVVGLIGVREEMVAIDSLILETSARWLPGDAQRAQALRQHEALAAALAQGSVRWMLSDGTTFESRAQPRGVARLGWAFWLLGAMALLLNLLALVVVLAKPDLRNLLYAVMALSQVGNLVLLAAGAATVPGAPAGLLWLDLWLRTGFDLATAAALVHVTGLRPRRLPAQALRNALAWSVAALTWAGVSAGIAAPGWWWTQAALILAGGAAIGQLLWQQWREPHPLALLLLRLVSVVVATMVFLTVIVAVVEPAFDLRHHAGSIGGSVWVVFGAAMLLMLPFLARTQELMREFSLLAGVSTVATALDLLFVAVFSLGSFASLTLALFVALAAYAGVRQWLVGRLLARERMTTERMFELLYRMAREAPTRAARLDERLDGLLRQLFDPLDSQRVARRASRSRVVADGASLVVPLPTASGDARAGSLVLGFAERGKRLFTADDALLADRLVDLVQRAVAYDQAVEQGRSEERVRIAQDLHDDIGARLLTLMYQAPTPEMEDYLRHTLKDLKTLTRGLAAPSHRLSHAVAEWKADLTQRLAVADCELRWSFVFDRDFELSVVQWSALTRVLRELASNVIAHARATRVEIEGAIDRGRLELTLADNGHGRRPETWSHGLGLGGVRKRVKQLGGEVHWSENQPQGIVCRVNVAAFGPGGG